ncbi:lipase family protein [Agromyces sp. ZXT2-6]|uniref:lipase family protein n=1 Tax=Agromyces sp. ZXT2-6 TaxID=3461153 RepID=UPI004054D602
MSDLVIRGGGATSVETEALVVEAARLAAVSHILDGWSARVGGIRHRLGEIAAAEGSETLGGLVIDLDTAQSGFTAGGVRTAELAWSLRMGAGRYGRAEWLSTLLAEAGERVTAGMLGIVAPGLLLAGASAAAILAPGLAVGSAIMGTEATAAGLLALVEAHGLPILSDPAFVALVRATGDHVDEFVAGLFRSGGLFGLGAGLEAPENSALLLGAATVLGVVTGSRALRETDVRVTGVATPVSAVSPLGPPAPGTAAPRGTGDLADRIPAPPPGGPQVRIERYDGPDGPRWIVYSSGTVDFGPVPRGEPYDTTSNVHVVTDASERAGLVGMPLDSGAAERSVRAAMEAAGVASGDPVLVVGHSAGGIIAANLAADPDLDVVGAVSFGGPVAQVPTAATPVLSVVHSEDLVPALGGSGVVADGRLVVERSIDASPSLDEPLPAHALTAYRDTAELVDGSDHPRVEEFTRLVGEITGGGPARTTYWHAGRAPS